MSAVRLKPLHQQVILITGASSGIGLVTARMAAEAGAKVILVSRNEGALSQISSEINGAGGDSIFAVADVADVGALTTAAEAAVNKYGRIDTWVNDAGASIFGKIEDVNVEDDRRLFETNFWGVVNGSRLAAQYLKEGGALINLGSIVSDRAVPLQGMYSASKHAVLGFTDAFRMEIEEAKLPISVTLIKPAAIDTPFAQHAKSYLGVEPTLPPPVYAPELVAHQILHAATHPVRELYVGGGGKLLATLGNLFPGFMDWYMEKAMFKQQTSDRPLSEEESLHESRARATATGNVEQDRMIRTHSAYNFYQRNSGLLLTIVTAAVGALAAYWVLRPMLEKSKTQQLKEELLAQASRVSGQFKERAKEFFESASHLR